MKWQDKITICVTLHNRGEYIRRLIEYYKDSGIRIIVGDSSEEPLLREEDSSEITYRYIKNELYNEKLLAMAEMADTPYIIELPDDDFVLLSAIWKCMEFLECNQDYVAASGFMAKLNEETHELDYSYRKDKVAREYLKDFYSNDPVERILWRSANYWEQSHFVMRRSTYIDFQKMLLMNRHLLPGLIQEKAIGCFLSIIGNTKVVPVLYMVRSEDRMIRDQIDQFPKDEVDLRIPLETVFKRLEDGGDPLAELLSSKIHISRNDAHRFVKKFFHKVIDVQNSRSSKLWRFSLDRVVCQLVPLIRLKLLRSDFNDPDHIATISRLASN